MKKVTREFEIFSFKELNKEAKAKVLEKFRDTNINHEWYEFTIDQFIQDMKAQGVEIDQENVFFSGFYSQGDGASFKASIDLAQYLNTKTLKKKYKIFLDDDEVSFYINQGGQYSHSMTMSIDSNYNIDNKKQEELIDDLEKNILNYCRGMADKLFSILGKEYESLISDEVVAETIEANDYEFLADGSIFNY